MVIDTSYRIFFFLHIASIVVAFAPAIVALMPGGGAAREAMRAASRTVYSPALILSGFFGVGLILTSDELWEFSQAWISLAFLVWIAMNGVYHVFVLGGRRIGSGSSSRPGGIDVQSGEAILTVLFVIMLYLMIWKPGGPF